ncbi:MAG TPA: carboxypeptidase-like regulatory domain-containing protein [Candidatus Anammoximicrobium sp.]|nr:carboxypeptidase-like regulatory domain-containing protein [Candidatus Anammoximicrobium sp.]
MACRWAAVLLLAVVASGCGQDTGGRLGLSGTVRFQGAPLQTGTIEFASSDAKQLTGSTITDGKYSVPADKGLPPGKYTVRISAAQDAGAAPAGPPGPESMTQQAKALIPPQYNVESTLSADVTEDGNNVFDFDLK